MSSPDIGIGRISQPYTVNSFDHVVRMYVSSPTLSGSDWLIDLRPSVGGTINWTAAVDDFLTKLTAILGTGATIAAATLEQYSATGWLPRATYTGTLGSLTGSANPAMQCTVTLRDTGFTRPKIVVMEGNQVAPFHTTSPTGGAGGLDAFIDGFLPGGSGGARPYNVMTNMHGLFLNTSPFVAATLTFNRKLRRARGLA